MNAVFAPVLKKGLFLLGGLSALLLLASCDTPTAPTSGDLRGTVTLYIVDVRTNLPVEDVRVELLGVGSANTKEGHVNFKDVKAGTYFVRLSKKGYESCQATITSEVRGSETVVAVNFSGTLNIHKLGVKVRGLVLAPNPKGEGTLAVRNATVNLRFLHPFIFDGVPVFLNPVRTVKTDSNGRYLFEDLPEYAVYEVEVPDVLVGGRNYRQEYVSIDNAPMTSAAPVFTASSILLSPTPGGSLTVHAPSNLLVKGQPLMLEFSNPIDTAKLAFFTIRLSMVSSDVEHIATRLTWSKDRTTLSIMPYQADWADGFTYEILLSEVTDDFGGTLSTYLDGFAVSAPAPVTLKAVTNLRLRATTSIRGASVDTTIVDYGTSPYRLSWTRVVGADGYSVFYRHAPDSAWQLQGVNPSPSLPTDTTVSVTLTPVTPVGKAWTRYLMVVPNSPAGSVPYSLGAVMTVRDGVKPSLNTTGSAITAPGGASFNNATASARAITLTLSTVLTGGQNDPIDTTKKPIVRIGNGGAAGTFAAPTFVWTSRTGGTLNVSVPANTDGSGDTVVVDFSAVTDLAGNTFDNLPNAPVLRYLTP